MLKEKNVILTGAGGGIGKVITRHFLDAGANLILIDNSEDSLDKLKIEHKENAHRIQYFTGDITNCGGIKSIINQVVAENEVIDVLINNAGIQAPIGPFQKNDLSLWKKNIDVNLFGAVNMTHSVLPSMIRYRKGKIINMSGGGSTSPRPNFSAYAIAKTGIVRFTETIAVELQKYNIDVNAVAPGAINTGMLDEVLESEDLAGKEYMSSLKRKEIGGNDPNLAAELIIFLASEYSDGITGKLISAPWDPWNDKSFQDLLREDKDLATLRRIDNKYFYGKS